MHNVFSKQNLLIAFSALSISCLAGCAHNRQPTDPQDPYENYNRAVFRFNMGVDKLVYRPVAKVYDKITPSPVQKGVTNFFNNINEFPVIANDILQANLNYTMNDSWRLILNSTIGVFGLFDVAKHAGLKPHDQDFGLTMAKWGVHQSPYLLLPFLGPGTARDQLSLFTDTYAFSVYPHIYPDYRRYEIYALDLTQARAAYLPADKLVDQAFDPYVFVRNAYLQKRQHQIQDLLHPNNHEDLEQDDIRTDVSKAHIQTK